MKSPGRTNEPRKPRIEILETPSGKKSLIVDGVLFHSRYDPMREAARQAADIGKVSVLVFLSPGLGYVVDAATASSRIIIERHAGIAALRPDLDPLVNPSASEVEAALEQLPGWEEGRIAVHSGVVLEADRGYYAEVKRAVERAIDRRAEEVATTRAFTGIWEKNLAANAPLFLRAGKDRSVDWIGQVAARFVDRAVIILAAGPSLGPDLEVIARWRASGRPSAATWLADPLIVAVDSALPAALAAGLRPDLCVTIDPQTVKARSLENLGSIPLIASVLSPPEIMRAASTLFLFGQGHPSEGEYGIPKDAVVMELGGSVATAAATLAAHFRARAVVLVGQDLAILGGATHVKGTHHERERVEVLNRFGSSEQMRSIGRKGRLRPGVDGTEVQTTPVMDSYRLYFERLAARNSEIRWVQTSPRGLRIGGMEHVSITNILLRESEKIIRCQL